MRPARLTAALIAAVALTACSSESITAPTRRAADPSFSQSSTCRAGYIAASGRCDGGSTSTSTTTQTDGTTCRAGYIAISGRCE